MTQEEFKKRISEANCHYWKNNPCRYCTGNGCDDCRGCSGGEEAHELWLKVKELKEEYKQKFGEEYD